MKIVMEVPSGGGGDISATQASFTNEASVSITGAKIGDIVFIVYQRVSGSGSAKWNNESAFSSPDLLYSEISSLNTLVYKVSQSSNTFSISNSSAVTGSYYIITN